MVKALHYIYWLIIFSYGILILFDFPTAIFKVGVPLITLLLFIEQIIRRRGRIFFPFIKIIVLFIFFTFLSAIINRINFFNFIYFLIFTLNAYFYFIVIINENNDFLIFKIKKIVIYLIAIQIPVIIFKFFNLGITESGGIGTIAVHAGSLSMIFPCLLISIFISYYFHTKKNKYLLYILFFTLFSLIGSKRAILLFIPLQFLFGYILHYFIFNKNQFFTSNNIYSSIKAIFLVIFIIIFTAKAIPKLNPEGKLWGSFDFNHIIYFISDYTKTKNNSLYEIRRLDGFVYFIDYLFNSDTNVILFGEGAGKLIKSKFNENQGSMGELYGVRYGGRMGIIWLLLQVGLVGTFLFLYLLFSLNKFIYKKYKSNFRSDPLIIGFFIASIVIIVDLLFYSNVFMTKEIIKGLYFSIAGFIINYNHLDRLT